MPLHSSAAVQETNGKRKMNGWRDVGKRAEGQKQHEAAAGKEEKEDEEEEEEEEQEGV